MFGFILILLLLLSQVLCASEDVISEENSAGQPSYAAVTIERLVEVSHWGNVAIEEHVELEHKGAVFKGPFSRIDFMSGKLNEPVFTAFETHLPVGAHDIYYRDKIGNISSSMVILGKDEVVVRLKPRFPIFGGWKTNYVLGYNVPSSGLLSSNGSQFALKVNLVDAFENAVIEKIRVKVILPEKCKNVKMIAPYSIDRLPDDLQKTFLDIEGRPVIVFEKANVVDSSDILPFAVFYEYNKSGFLREPLMCITAFFVLFLIGLVYTRCNFSIGKEVDMAPVAKKD